MQQGLTSPLTATYTSAFSVAPSFAVLLSSVHIKWYPELSGFTCTYGTPGTTSTNFLVEKDTYNGLLLGITLRWVAPVGEAVQIFPIEVTLNANGTNIYDMPFEYPTLVQWTAATTDVVITAVITSFILSSSPMTDFQVDSTIAKCNGTAYDYSSTSLFVLPKESLFGSNAPFTTVGSTNVVKIRATGFSGSRTTSTLFFVQAPSASSTPPTQSLPW